MSHDIIRAVFVGAGAVNFGGAEGPWDHSRRLEQLEEVQVVAIVDPDLPKARKVLETKLSGPFADRYKDCVVIANYLEALKTAKPHVAFIGKLGIFGEGESRLVTSYYTVIVVLRHAPLSCKTDKRIYMWTKLPMALT